MQRVCNRGSERGGGVWGSYLYMYVYVCMYGGIPPALFWLLQIVLSRWRLDAAAGSRGLFYRAISDEKGHDHPAYASHARPKPSLKQQFDMKCWNTGFLVDGLLFF